MRGQLGESARLRTGADSFARVSLPSGDALSLRASSALVFSELSPAAITLVTMFTCAALSQVFDRLPKLTLALFGHALSWRGRTLALSLEEVRTLTADIAGIDIQIQEQQGGPSQGKPVEVRLTAAEPGQLAPAAQGVRDAMAEIGGFVDVEDTLPLPGVEWRLTVDRQQAARYGADVTLLGQAVQMLTGGLKLAEYRPDDAIDEALASVGPVRA